MMLIPQFIDGKYSGWQSQISYLKDARLVFLFYFVEAMATEKWNSVGAFVWFIF